MEAFVIALIGGLVGAGLSYVVQNFLTMVSLDVASLNDHIDEIRKIEDFAIEYWLIDPKKSPDENAKMEAKLGGSVGAPRFFIKEAKRILGNHYSEYSRLDDLLFDAATGGEFQSVNKSIDLVRVVEVIEICNEYCAFLRNRRRALYWAR